MSWRSVHITAHDRAWHEAFFTHVAEVFPGVDFRRWATLGAWSAEYVVAALIEDDRVVASIGRTQMPLIIGGRERGGLQLGAVATRASHRGRGLARMLMDEVLAEADRALMPVFLFANPTVLDFYPRFGFRRVEQSRFGAELVIVPAAGRVQPFDAGDARQRARLAALCARAMPSGWAFGSRRYYSILLWHLCNRPLAAHWIEPEGALAVTSCAADRLIVHDIIAPRAFDLGPILPALATHAVASIEFGFEPADRWPGARPRGPDDALLFVRGLDDLPAAPFRFPDLAQT